MLPRLTQRKTVEVIANETGENPSKITARLDKAKREKLGKRARQNTNPVGSTEFAIRFAVQKLGMERVSELLGVGGSVLYKALNASDGARKLPELGWSKMIALVAELRRNGHTEFISHAIQAQGDAAAAEAGSEPKMRSVHHALTLTTIAHGDVARAVALASDPAGDKDEISAAEASEILDAIARHMEATRMLQEQVMAAAKVREKAL